MAQFPFIGQDRRSGISQVSQSLGFWNQACGMDLSEPSLGLVIGTSSVIGPICWLCVDLPRVLRLRALVRVRVRPRVCGQRASERGGWLGLAQVGIRISPALNPFWGPK